MRDVQLRKKLDKLGIVDDIIEDSRIVNKYRNIENYQIRLGTILESVLDHLDLEIKEKRELPLKVVKRGGT